MGRKIGIMGGTFNPIHYGHLLLGETARCAENLDEIWFMPSGISYLKKDSEIPDGQVRLAMVKAAICDNPHFKPSDLEVLREGNTYTCDTLISLNETYPEDNFYFILGADSLFSIEEWMRPEEIFSRCVILAGVRGAVSREETEQQKNYLISKFHAKIKLLPYPYVDISSTDIRNKVLNGQSIRYLVPQTVEEFILRNRLYTAK